MPYQTEPSANFALGDILQRMLSRSTVLSEHTQAIAGHAGAAARHPFNRARSAPVVLEAEYMPAASERCRTLL